MRASIDWPNCPMITISSAAPRKGPKISRQGEGRAPLPRNAAGMPPQEASKSSTSASPDDLAAERAAFLANGSAFRELFIVS